MEFRKVQKTGEEVSLLGLGLMRLPLLDGNQAHIDEAAAMALVDACYQGGVNYFDTAYYYHDEASEVFAGKALARYARDSYFLATKLPLWDLETLRDAQVAFATQLARLQTDYVDFYLMHAMDAHVFETFRKLELLPWLDELRSSGKVRKMGFSFHDKPELLEEILDAYDWDFVQIQLNYIDWDFQRAKEQYEMIEARGLPCIVMEPVRGGRLADLGPEANRLLQAQQPGKSIASWAMRYVAALPNVLTVLSGMSTPEQVADNLATFDKVTPLGADDLAALDKAAELFRQAATIPCTQCRYCMPCPADVDIPGLMTLLNKSAFDGSTFALRSRYARFPKEHNASRCVQCGQCESACPQHIQIVSIFEKLLADTAEKAD